jgi:hypothetical protein
MVQPMMSPAFNDGVEKKYQLGINPSAVADLWRDLSSFLRSHRLEPPYEITSVGSGYFDDEDCHRRHFVLLGRLMMLRTRGHERYGRFPEPIKKYRVEVTNAQGALKKIGCSRLATNGVLTRTMNDVWLLKKPECGRKKITPRCNRGGMYDRSHLPRSY